MAEDIQIGAVLGGTYQITALLGRGGMGAVWTASHLRLPGKRVAIKVLLDTNQNDESYARFRREAEIASRIGHPNIVEVLDWNTLANGTPYLVLELLLGESLGVRLMQGPIALDPAIDIVRQIGSALHAAHKAGVVHRDLKPDNIFLTPTDGSGHVADRVKILDFGISKIKNSTTLQTQEQRLLGTPQYMAPEQALGKNQLVDHRTDLFALAAIVYEMLSGRPAFGGENIAQVVFKVVYEEPEPLEALVPGLPPHILGAIKKALAKERDARQPDVLSFIAELTGRPLSTLDRKRESKVEAAFAPTTDIMSQPPVPPSSLARGTTPGPPPVASGTAPSFAPPLPTVEKKRGRGMWLALGLIVAAGGGVATAITLMPKEQPVTTGIPAVTAADAAPRAALAAGADASPAVVVAATATPDAAAAVAANPDPPTPLTPTPTPTTPTTTPNPIATVHSTSHSTTTHTTPRPLPHPPAPPPEPTPPADTEPTDVASELRDAERALSEKKFDEAIRIARHSMQTKITPHAYGVMARAYCGQRDLGNAKAAAQHLRRPARGFVLEQCRRLGFPIDD